VYSVARGWNQHYRGDPPIEPGVKPVFMDMDHVAAVDQDGDNDWNDNPATPWKLLTRGYHQCMYDHDYWKPGSNGAGWDATRHNIGMAARLANGMDLAHMQPSLDLSSTTYCLANPGREYLVFAPDGGEFTLNGLVPGQTYRAEWYHVETRQLVPQGRYQASGALGRFRSSQGNAVLLLELLDSQAARKKSE
jgi:hypothetical protein